MKILRKLSAGLLAFAVTLPIVISAVSAAYFYAGQEISIGTINSTTSREVADGLSYDEAYMTDSEGNSQLFRMLTFNPTDGCLAPLVYSKYSGYGANAYDNALSAESRGYDVKAAVNCSFFGLTGTSCNTYGGVNVSDGRILQGSDSHPEEWVLAFDSDGNASLVKSRVAYRVTYNGVTEIVDCVNMCPDDYTYDVIYYYDDLCGDKTDVKAAGVEVVFESVNKTELRIGTPLVGKVAEVREVSKGGDITAGQFVLYAPDESSYATYLRGFAVGDEATVTAEETVEASKEVMESCNTAFVTYGYHIINNGVNVTSTNGLGESYNTRRGQKTGIGIKADGTVVIVTTNGREDEYPGLNTYEVADMLIEQGCVTGVNLDGGYSTQMVTEKADGSLTADTPLERRIANSLLIVERGPSERVLSDLESTVADALSYYLTYEMGEGIDNLTSLVNEAQRVKNDPRALQGDFRMAESQLLMAMDAVEKLSYRKGVYTAKADSCIRWQPDGESQISIDIPAGESFTVTKTVGAYGYTSYRGAYGWAELEDCFVMSSAEGSSPVITAPETVYPGEDVLISWLPITGAAGYTYRVLELDGTDSIDGAEVIAEGWVCGAYEITVPYETRTDGKYIMVEVSADYPGRSERSAAYIASSELPFRDVARDHWGYSAAVHTYNEGYFSGVTASLFSPNGSMTRAMMATVIYRMAGSPQVNTSGTTFKDVDIGSWYYNAVLWCQANGIVNGVSAERFDPNGNVTREMAACMMQRYVTYLGIDASPKNFSAAGAYDDFNNISPFALEAMVWCVENGILKGSGNRLSPTAQADRIQLATIICNFDTYLASAK